MRLEFCRSPVFSARRLLRLDPRPTRPRLHRRTRNLTPHRTPHGPPGSSLAPSLGLLKSRASPSSRLSLFSYTRFPYDGRERPNCYIAVPRGYRAFHVPTWIFRCLWLSLPNGRADSDNFSSFITGSIQLPTSSLLSQPLSRRSLYRFLPPPLHRVSCAPVCPRRRVLTSPYRVVRGEKIILSARADFYAK